MSILGINRYKNPHSKRKIKARAKRLAAQLCQLDMSTKVMDSCDWRRHEMQAAMPYDRDEPTSFKKEKPLRQSNTAGGKQKLQRAAVPLI